MANLEVMQISKLIELLGGVELRKTFVTVLDGRIAMGENPLQPNFEIDFEGEKVRSRQGTTPSKEANSALRKADAHKASRFMGGQWFELKGKRYECQSVKDILLNALPLIEQVSPGTLENLSQIKKRTKRIIARNRADLFSQQRLAEDYSVQIAGDWWVGTNNSSQEVESWLRLALGFAGMSWGKDFDSSL